MRPGDMHKLVGGKLERLQARAWPPAERDWRIKQAERSLQERQRRVAARDDQRRPQYPDGPDRPAHPGPVIAFGHKPASREKSGAGRHQAPQRERYVLAPY